METTTPPTEPNVETANKPGKKKWLIAIAAVCLLVAASAAAYVVLRPDKPQQTATQTQQPAATKTEKVWVVNYTDDTSKYAEIAYDGSAVKPIDDAYVPSPNSKYIAKVTKQGVEVAKASQPNNFKVVSELGSADSIAFAWYDSSDRLIVYTTTTTNKPADPQVEYIPQVDQTFYKVDVDGSHKVKLFDHHEVYGGAFTLGVSSARNELYWATAGEGGPMDRLNVSSLVDGSLKKKLTPTNLDSQPITFHGQYAYYPTQDGKLYRINLDTGKDSLLLNPLGDLAGLTDTFLTPTCYVGGSIESVNADAYNDGGLLFSTVSNKPHETTIQALDATTNTAKTLLTLKSVRQLSILGADAHKALFSRARTNICNAQGEKVETSNLYVLDRASGKVTNVDLQVEQQFFSGNAHLFERPVQSK
jgi:hypothetical protein